MTVFSLRAHSANLEKKFAQNLDVVIRVPESEDEGEGRSKTNIHKQVQAYYKIQQRQRLEHINILQTVLRGTMLCNLLKLPIFSEDIIDKTLVVLLGIASNFLGIVKSISLIRKEQRQTDSKKNQKKTREQELSKTLS
jgi:hypothetical protein